MNTSPIYDNPDLQKIDFKNKLRRLYTSSGIPKKYHFCTMETDWSVTYSPKGKLTGVAKKRSESIYQFVVNYIMALDSIINGQGMKVKFKDSVVFVSDLILDGTKSSGKTFLLSMIAQSAINNGHTTKFVEWSDYLDRFQSFEARKVHEDFFNDCLDVDFLIFDSIFQYDINNKFFAVQLDRLITTRLNAGKITICSIDTVSNQNPVFGFMWNKFTRETFTFKLPEASLTNENKSKRT
jgi:hypothetical protein